MTAVKKSAISAVIKKYQDSKSSLIAVLQDIQEKFGYLPKEALQQVSASLEIPLSKLFAVATFYNAFSLEPQGKHVVCICEGTACHVKNANGLAQSTSRALGLDSCEGTTADGQLTVKKVRCLGCCSIAPVVKINETIHGSMTQNKLANVLKQYRKEK